MHSYSSEIGLTVKPCTEAKAEECMWDVVHVYGGIEQFFGHYPSYVEAQRAMSTLHTYQAAVAYLYVS